MNKLELWICKAFYFMFFLPILYLVWMIDCMYIWEIVAFLMFSFAGTFCTRFLEFYIETGKSLFKC